MSNMPNLLITTFQFIYLFLLFIKSEIILIFDSLSFTQKNSSFCLSVKSILSSNKSLKSKSLKTGGSRKTKLRKIKGGWFAALFCMAFASIVMVYYSSDETFVNSILPIIPEGVATRFVLSYRLMGERISTEHKNFRYLPESEKCNIFGFCYTDIPHRYNDTTVDAYSNLSHAELTEQVHQATAERQYNEAEEAENRRLLQKAAARERWFSEAADREREKEANQAQTDLEKIPKRHKRGTPFRPRFRRFIR